MGKQSEQFSVDIVRCRQRYLLPVVIVWFIAMAFGFW